MAKFMNFLLSLVLIFQPSLVHGVLYNVADFGARADGRTDSTQSFLSAWALACACYEPATIYVPHGPYLVGHAVFQGPCRSERITIKIDGILVAPVNRPSNGKSKHWLFFHDVQGVSIYGGTLDGQGTALWACKSSGARCPSGAESLTFNNAKDVVISGLRSINSQLYHIVIDCCTNVVVQGVKIVAPWNSPNTDGIHVERSTGVTITGAGIRTGDDCISVGPGTRNLWIEQIACGPGHGISIGSLGKKLREAGVVDVTVRKVVFTGTKNGLRIKSWGRPSTGFVRGVLFEHAIMQNVQNPIIIDQNYCPHEEGCPDKNSGIKISQVTYSDIQGTSASQVAVKFDCSATNPCSGIELQDVKLTYRNHQAQASCKYVDGTATGFVVPRIRCLIV